MKPSSETRKDFSDPERSANEAATQGEPLTADFTRSLPGGKLDDSEYEAIESALDKALAPCRSDDGRWLTLAERVAASAAIQAELLAELKWCFMGAGNLERMSATIAKAEGRS